MREASKARDDLAVPAQIVERFLQSQRLEQRDAAFLVGEGFRMPEGQIEEAASFWGKAEIIALGDRLFRGLQREGIGGRPPECRDECCARADRAG